MNFFFFWWLPLEKILFLNIWGEQFWVHVPTVVEKFHPWIQSWVELKYSTDAQFGMVDQIMSLWNIPIYNIQIYINCTSPPWNIPQSRGWSCGLDGVAFGITFAWIFWGIPFFLPSYQMSMNRVCHQLRFRNYTSDGTYSIVFWDQVNGSIKVHN